MKTPDWVPRIPSRGTALFFSDIVMLVLTFITIVLVYDETKIDLELYRYWQLIPWLLICPIINFISHLYSPAPIPTHEELGQLAKSITIAYLCITLTLFLRQKGDIFSRGIMLSGWFISLGALPFGRYLMRRIGRRHSWWGPKSVLFGPAEAVGHLLEEIQRQFDPAIQPIAYAGSMPLAGKHQLRHLPSAESLRDYQGRHPDACAVVLLDASSSLEAESLVNEVTQIFHHVILIPTICSSGVTPVTGHSISFGTATGFKVFQNLFDPKRCLLKRTFDIVFSSLGLLCLFPFLVCIAIWIMVESPGSPFFRHKRIGLGGKPFYILKFRSMVVDAEVKLQKILAQSPALREEWKREQKLKDDPRLISIGSFLRRTSIDELPQLWNVLKGEMSLVGPRPIVEEEISKYGPKFNLYARVRPGMSGLWQVSGRNDCTYDERIKLDQYYIYNWSIMLDILILFKTIPAVFKKKGSY